MKPKWIEVISIKFKGKRFADHSIDVGSLAGLAKFEDIILQIAKAAWKTAHPDRDRVPRNLRSVYGCASKELIPVVSRFR